MVARTREFDTDIALERAMELFRQRGFEATSTRDLAAAIGIGAGSLYAAFGSKEGLYVAALERHREHLTAAVDRAVDPARDIRAVLRDLLEQAYKGGDPKYWGPGCLLLRAAAERGGHNPRVDRLLRDALLAVEEAFAEMIRGGQRSGRLPEGLDPTATAHFLVTVVQGLRVMALMGSAPAKLDATVQAALRCLD